MKTNIKWVIAFTVLGISQNGKSDNWGPKIEDPSNALALIDDDAKSGYALYRSGIPSEDGVAQFCQLGIQEIMVLSGDANKAEWRFSKQCPSLKVIYNVEQNSQTPLGKNFLDQFDAWVADAKANGKKIAIRCDRGWHRTGRLAGYYQLKYQHTTYEDASVIMTNHGKWMTDKKFLYLQLQALDDFIHHRACSVDQKYCVSQY